jgi:hypothetical protein
MALFGKKIQFGQRLATLASKTKCKQTFPHTKWTKKQFHIVVNTCAVVGKSFPASNVSSQIPFKKAIF